MRRILLSSVATGALAFGALGLSAPAALAESPAPSVQAECPPNTLPHPITGECIPIPPGPNG